MKLHFFGVLMKSIHRIINFQYLTLLLANKWDFNFLPLLNYGSRSPQIWSKTYDLNDTFEPSFIELNVSSCLQTFSWMLFTDSWWFLDPRSLGWFSPPWQRTHCIWIMSLAQAHMNPAGRLHYILLIFSMFGPNSEQFLMSC